MLSLDITLFGQFQVILNDSHHGSRAATFKTDLARALLAYLAVENHKSHRRSSLVGLLWPEQPEDSARHNLRQTLLYLRKSIHDVEMGPFLRINRQEIQLETNSAYHLDVSDFYANIQAVENHRHTHPTGCLACMKHLEQAVEIYRGDFLEHFFLESSAPFEEWSMLMRETLRRYALQALNWLAEYDLQRRNYARASRYAWRQIQMDPLREQAYRQFMAAMAGRGQRSEALSQFESLSRLLNQELGVSPGAETIRLYQQIKSQQSDIRPPADQPLRLPRQFTPFLGRQAALDAANARLDNPACGLLTLTGMGGVGKTRLAVEVAQRRAGLYPDGVVFVPLAGVETSAELVSAITFQTKVSITGARDARRQLIERMGEKEMLLVLDNFEHLVPSADLLLDMLQSAPGLKILVTSRQPLNLRAEWVLHISGLACPPESGQRVIEYPAAQLFLQAARRLASEFEPGYAELQDLGRIARILDGLPLALELAAGLTLTTSCRMIADSIAANLDLLTTQMPDVPARQRSMRAVFDYTWDLLTAQEAMVLARLAVFQGGFTAQAASEVAQASMDILNTLNRKSLINQSGGDRFQVHELVQQYAAERLSRNTDMEKNSRDSHAHYFAAYLQEHERLLGTAQQTMALDKIQIELANLLRAWHWVTSQDAPQLARPFVKGLWGFYDDRNLYEAGQAAFNAVWEKIRTASAPHPLQAEMEMIIGFFAFRRGQFKEARTHLESSLAQYRRTDDLLSCAHCLYYLAGVGSDSGDMTAAREYLEQSLQIYENFDSRRHIGNTLAKLGSVLELTGCYPEARTALERSLEIKRALGAPIPISISLNNLGLLLWRTGEYGQAESCFLESLTISREAEAHGSVAIDLSNLARLYITLGRYAEADKLLQESMDLESHVGNSRHQTILYSISGTLARQQGNLQTALNWLQSAAALSRETGNQRELAYTGLHFAQIYLDQGDLLLAQDWLTQTEKIARELGLLPLQLATCLEGSRLLAAQKRIFDAFTVALYILHQPAAWHSVQVAAREQVDQLGERLSKTIAAEAEYRAKTINLEEIGLLIIKTA
jgi:predicted ATPase/DNA-binding SARP family transcriptional activator